MKLLLISLFMLMIAPEEVYSVRGKITFDGRPPPLNSFQVGLCELNGSLCEYNVIPPGPRACPDENGEFEIVDVPPGEYGLVFHISYWNQILPWWPDGSGEILFNVGPDVELGELAYDDWPCEILKCPLYMSIALREE